jgi:hypothetical protein
MQKALAILGSALLLSSPVHAQPDSPLQGAWVGHYVAPTGVQVKAEFTVTGAEGTWHSFVPQTQKHPNPCLEQPHSVAITEPTAGQFQLVIQASKTLSGCQDAHATVKLTDPGTLQGKFSDGREVVLKRK